ncbi:LexA family protein [Lacticaseibacillus suilingensis]|uniref:LexA family protein n=2 Tax=Lacticaseibacillus TaxID=2759736 RepID=UPI003A4DA568
MRMLTPKQWRDRYIKILTLIDQSLDYQGCPPTLDSMGDKLHLSKSSVQVALVHMRRNGLVNWDRNAPRSLWVTEKGVSLYEEALHD